MKTIRNLFLIYIILNSLLATAEEAEKIKIPFETKKFDQEANKAKDHTLVQNIRQELIKNKTLSSNSKNIQIIIVDKEIVLKGPVNSESEKTTITSLVNKMAGGYSMRDQLEIKPDTVPEQQLP